MRTFTTPLVLEAINARIEGEFDNKILCELIHSLSPNIILDIQQIIKNSGILYTVDHIETKKKYVIEWANADKQVMYGTELIEILKSAHAPILNYYLTD